MQFCVVGAGAMGGSFAALLERAGHQVCVIDTWAEHIDAINADGLRMTGVLGEHRARLSAQTTVVDTAFADWVIVFTDSNATGVAAETAAQVLKPDGTVITMQNGIGNVEKLIARLGAQRVVGGSSMCSAARVGPGEVAFTHHATTSIGELDGAVSTRIEALAQLLRGVGLDVQVETHIVAKIWNKFVLNCGINALCAVSGLRVGEMARIPEMYALQDRIIDEALRVTAAKGIDLPGGDVRTTIKKASFYKFNQPSMLQYVLAGRKTEIDSINGALIAEAGTLGIPTPYNEALVAMLKGRELQRMQEQAGTSVDYVAWEAQAKADPLPE
jgi:2-dehydropantoate 2-reductase